jgi:hypothetical protein
MAIVAAADQLVTVPIHQHTVKHVCAVHRCRRWWWRHGCGATAVKVKPCSPTAGVTVLAKQCVAASLVWKRVVEAASVTLRTELAASIAHVFHNAGLVVVVAAKSGSLVSAFR